MPSQRYPGAHAVLGAPLCRHLTSIYLEWVHADIFPTGAPGAESTEASIRGFIREMSLLSARGRLICRGRPVELDIDMTLGDLLGCHVQLPNSPPFPVDLMFTDLYCTRQLDDLLSDVVLFSCRDVRAEDRAPFLGAAGCGSWTELLGRALSPAGSAALCQLLRAELMQQVAGRRLSAFFGPSASATGFRTWWPGAFTDFGDRLPRHSTYTPEGAIQVTVSRYASDVSASTSVTPYEWQADWRRHRNADLPDAVACGMVYEIARDGDRLLGSVDDLRWVSDRVADTDAAQVIAFLQQHADAAQLLEQGDLCFLWLWERREGTAPGIGAKVLLTALENLRQRFPRLSTLVVNLQPAQFDARFHEADPPPLQVARYEACESLERFLEALAPNEVFGGPLRLIATRSMSLRESLEALGVTDSQRI